MQPTTHEIESTQQTNCCIVGGGPAGVVLSLLLARQGIPVMLLEAHKDFNRDFRGDMIHPSTMQIMDELGLGDRLRQFPHTKIHKVSLMTPAGSITTADFSRLKTKYPYITFMPQVRFLEFIIEEAKSYPNFQLLQGANVRELIEEDGVIRGVRYRGHGGWHDVRAQLTVGADGRHSRLCQLAGLEAIRTSSPNDVLWFRLPRKPEEPGGTRVERGRYIALINRGDQWQISYPINKGSHPEIRAAGLDALRKSIVGVWPQLSDRVEHLHDWSQVVLLSVEPSRLKRWYRPGLLLIGDAAHVMSPVGGVGINCAIQDAVVAANVLSEPLKTGHLQLHHLTAVQRRRELPTRIIQAFQGLMQRQLLVRALNPDQPLTPPLFLRLPILRDIPGRLIGLGVWPVHVKQTEGNY